MAQATVFVDDAVMGRLPSLCAKDGTPTTDQLVVHSYVGGGNGIGIGWLLLLAGPLGWLGLFVVALARRPADVLTVRLPFSEAAHQRIVAARRGCRVASLATLASVVLALIGLTRHSFDGRLFAAAVAVLFLVAVTRWVMEWRRMRSASVDVSLDASRRWVTLSGVHPTFAARVVGDRSYSNQLHG